jgi:hypothetical protein
MRRRARASIGSLVTTVTVAFLVAASLSAQSSRVPRTAWGHPDLQGIWASNSATPLERPKVLAGRALLSPEEVVALEKAAAELFEGDTDAAFGDSVFEAALARQQGFKSNDGGTGNYNHFWLVERTFDNRTSLIIDPPDGRLPAMTAEARARQQQAGESRRLRPADGPEDRSLGERCITGTLPMTGRGYNSNYQLLQTPDHVVIHMEMMHDTRIIPLDGRPHLSPTLRGFMGDSRGRFEGDTLIIETKNLRASRNARGPAEQMTLVERFTRVDAGMLHYQFTVDDPATYMKPWTAMIPMKPAPGTGRIYEFACHEGNHGMLGILAGHRAQESAPVPVRTGSR